MGTLDCYRLFSLLGGGKRDRTADLLHAMQALSQLSYTPKTKAAQGGFLAQPAILPESEPNR